MIRSKKKNILLMLTTMICCLFLMCGISVSAESYQGIVCDDYGVLSEEEIEDLNFQLEETAQELSINIGVLITDQTDKQGVMDFADVYSENLFGINSNSILYLINMNDGYDWISTSGIAIDYYSDNIINDILQNTSGEYLLEDNMDFYGAIIEFDNLLIYEISSTDDNITILIIGLIISIIVSIITCGVIASRYKFHASTSAEVYAKTNDGGINFTRREDKFIRTYTTKVAIPKNNDSSSTHTSSGGGTHGGGGFQR